MIRVEKTCEFVQRLLIHLTLKLDDRIDTPARNLPYGNQRRLEIARALATRPKILLLDEPGANLDEAGRSVGQNVVASQRARGIAIIASNDPRDLALADETLSL